MPIKIKVLHDGMGLLYDCYGVLTGKDFIDANNQILVFSEKIKLLRYRLMDETAVNGINISELEMTTIASQFEKIASLGPDGAIVAVIAKDPFAFGLTFKGIIHRIYWLGDNGFWRQIHGGGVGKGKGKGEL